MRPCKSLFFLKKTLKAASSKNNLSEILVQKGFHIKKKKNVDLHGLLLPINNKAHFNSLYSYIKRREQQELSFLHYLSSFLSSFPSHFLSPIFFFFLSSLLKIDTNIFNFYAKKILP
jgi:hypothetical protein